MLDTKALRYLIEQDAESGYINDNHFDAVNHPNHYQSESGLEVIYVIDAFTDGLDGVEAFDTGNIIKYICRWKKKNGLQDLEKAKWYLENLIKEVKEKENEDAK